MTDSEKNTSGASQDAPDSPTGSPAEHASPVAPPWYRRPWFWGLLCLLCLLLLAAWLVWKEWQAAERLRASQEKLTAEARQGNESREDFLRRLRLLLEKEPCDVQRELDKIVPPSGVIWPPLGVAPHAPAPASPQASPAQAATPPASMAELMEQGTVLILAHRKEGLSMGSGFFVAPGYIVTNAHVVGDAAQAFVINKATKGVLTAKILGATQSGGRDFAVLQAEDAPPITPLKLAADVKRTERVSAWGFPGAITTDDPKFAALLQGNSTAAPEVVYTDGVVSVILQRNPPLIVHTATVSQGNSGGPLVNEKGEVVGINTFIKLDDESYRQSSLAIVSPSLTEYLRSAGVPFTLAAPPAPAPAAEATGRGKP